MKKIIIILAIFILGISPLTTLAQDNKNEIKHQQQNKNEIEHQQLCREFLLIAGGFENLEKVFDQLKSLAPQAKTPQEKAATDAIFSVIKEQQWDELIDKIVPVYQKYLTVDDLKAALKFYRSKEGQMVLDAQKSVLPELIPISMEWAQSLQSKIKEAIDKAMEQPQQ